MSSYETTLAAVLALTPAERLNLMLALGDSLRKPLDAPKPRKSRATASGAAAAGGGGGNTHGMTSWQQGTIVVRSHLKTLGISGKYALVIAKSLRSNISWPNPTLTDVENLVKELQASGTLPQQGGRKTRKNRKSSRRTRRR
jgi:hypothetical protein